MREQYLEATADLYNERFEKYGNSIKTVGWGSESSQKLRFDVLFRNLDPKGKIILDVGCGLGDLVPYLSEITHGNFHYIGVDIANKLILAATERFSNLHSKVEFIEGDLFNLSLPQVDIAILSGALSLKTDGIEQYAFRTMQRMFELSKDTACLNFLTKYVDFELEKNQHYYPEIVFSEAKKITKHVNLFHDYPLYEFTIQLLK